MADWQVGDMAMCVRGGHIGELGGGDYPESGKIYRVSGVLMTLWTDGSEDLGLVLPDAPPNIPRNHVWWAMRFIRITPGADIEGIEVERRVPVKERA